MNNRMMEALTGAVLAAFVAYGAAWYLGGVKGNFALVLLVATLVTGAYWVAERLVFLPRRRAAAERLVVEDRQRREELSRMGIAQVDGDVSEARERILAQPWWLDWTAGLFPVIVTVFFLRSFVVEPFKIPSGSMTPTLLTGDLILVNKFTYGLRLPVVNQRITEGNRPQRGDVMVFRYPPDPSLDYIKRVVGVPGDEVAYVNKRLSINGQPVVANPLPDYLDETQYFKQFEESLGTHKHRLLNDDRRPAFVEGAADFPGRESACRYVADGVICKVPEGHYFMMGDNRDNSLDSRYWGFVPEGNIVGKAFFIWMNFGNLKRIGAFD